MVLTKRNPLILKDIFQSGIVLLGFLFVHFILVLFVFDLSNEVFWMIIYAFYFISGVSTVTVFKTLKKNGYTHNMTYYFAVSWIKCLLFFTYTYLTGTETILLLHLLFLFTFVLFLELALLSKTLKLS